MVVDGPTVPSLRRFSNTLTHLRFINTVHISSASIQVNLMGCSALKSFIVDHHFDRRSAISLGDAVQIPWVSASIETLDISIEAEVVNFSQPGDERWAMWGAFARQIGRLTNLVSLRLLALPPDGFGVGNDMYEQCSLPGHLSLDPRTDEQIVPARAINLTAAILTGEGETVTAAHLGLLVDRFRTGFFSHLRDLSKLQKLQGSFHVNRATLSNAEINWIKDHWPTFRMLELYPAGYFNSSQAGNLPAAVVRLRNQMGIRVHAFREEEVRIWW